MSMSIYKYLTENKIVNSKEFEELYSIRAIKVNEKPLNDPNKKIEKGEKLK